MFEILGIQIAFAAPDEDGTFTFTGDIDRSVLTALRDAAVAAGSADGVTPEVLADVKQARAFLDAAVAEMTARAEATASFSAERDAELEGLEGLSFDDESDEGDDDSDEGDDDSDESDGDEEGDDESDEDTVTASAGWRPTAGAVSRRSGSATPPPAPVSSGAYADANWVAPAGADGLKPGESFGSLTQLAEALGEAAREVRGGGRKLAVARTFGSFTEAQKLTEDPGDNLAKFGGLQLGTQASTDAITAAMCAPAEPIYDLATASSTARPVKGSLATYQPRRGKVSIYPSPKLADIDEGAGSGEVFGRGIWTEDNDSDLDAVKATCARITCSDVDEYAIYGVYRCMTIKNMLWMTYPELVEAYLNRLGALTARLAESTLLDGMEGSPNTKAVTATASGHSGAVNLLATLISLTALAREEERYGDIMFDAWLPRWVVPALKVDLLRQKRTSGRLAERIPTTAELEASLRDSGIDVTWTLDGAESWAAVPVLTDGEDIPDFPTTVNGIIAPKGNLRALDRGDLTIGVAPGNIYRDNDSNSRNEATLFQESFEGLLDFGATNYAFTIEDVCLNGAQPADVTAITCS